MTRATTVLFDAPRPDSPKLTMYQQVVGHNVPSEIGGVAIRPGGIIIADEDGVVAIPEEASVALPEALQTIFEVEKDMEKAIQGNASDEELRAIISRKNPKGRL